MRPPVCSNESCSESVEFIHLEESAIHASGALAVLRCPTCGRQYRMDPDEVATMPGLRVSTAAGVPFE